MNETCVGYINLKGEKGEEKIFKHWLFFTHKRHYVKISKVMLSLQNMRVKLY